jgi:peroxiredoxin
MASELELEFRVLSDPELTAIDAFGLRHAGGGPWGDIARPAAYIVDRRGIVVWRDLTENWRVRPRPDDLLEVLASLP